MLTDDQLRQIMPGLPQTQRQQYLPHLQAAMDEFGVTTPLRAAAFLAQLAHESAQLTRFVENLNYSAKGLLATFGKYFTPALAAQYARQPERIANRVYANRLGNGPESSGDGWRYRGRGAIQITGRENYRTYGDLLGADLVNNPDQAAAGAVTFRTAGAFWKSKGCNELADRQDFITITKRINGGTNGLPDRQQFYDRAKRVLMARSRGGTRAARAGGGDGGGSRVPERHVPPDLSRGIYPGLEFPEEAAPAGGGRKKSAAKERATKKRATKKAGAGKSAAKKAGARKTGAKKTRARKTLGKAGAAGKRATRKGGAGKGSTRTGAAGKGGAKKGAARKGGTRRGGRKSSRA